MNRTEQGVRRYFIELTSVLAAFSGLIVLRSRVPPGDLKSLLHVASLLPIWLGGWVIIRAYRAVDEYHKRIILNSFAIGSALTALLTLSYMQLQGLGLPAISIAWTWPLMGACWGLCSMFFSWRDYASRHGVAKTLKWTGTMLALVAIPTALYAVMANALGWPHSAGISTLVATAIFLALNAYFIFVKRLAA
jgi:hypothetical protein